MTADNFVDSGHYLFNVIPIRTVLWMYTQLLWGVGIIMGTHRP